MSEQFDEPWNGKNKILLSVDIGITHSSVSFMYLEHGIKRAPNVVTRWPGQEGSGGEAAVPSVVWYDTDNKAVAFGAEAQLPHIEEQAIDKGWSLAQNFKVHLYPQDDIRQQAANISALPLSISLRQIYSDFLRYLLIHTKSHFEDRVIDGARIWERYKSTLEVVMTHPSGWGPREQSFLRDVVVNAGYTTRNMAPSSIRFTTDANASAYYHLLRGGFISKLKIGDVFVLCDAGINTTNVSIHKVDSIVPTLSLNNYNWEYSEGTASIDIAAEKYIHQTSTDGGISPGDANDFARAGVEEFKRYTKFAFGDETKEYLVQISNARLNNPAIRTRRGRMVLPGSIVKSFYVDYINMVRRAVDRAIQRLAVEAGANVSHILVAGQFGQTSNLQLAIKETYQTKGYMVILPHNSTSGEVAGGALIWDTRASNGCRPRRSLGIETSCGHWLQIVAKGSMISPGTEVKKPVSLRYSTPHPKIEAFQLSFLSYTGENDTTHTKDAKGDPIYGFRKWFTLEASLDTLREGLEQRLDSNSVVHWRLNFNVCVRFGETGLEAYLEWKEKGITRNTPATIQPDYEF